MKYEKLNKKILKLVGGKENIIAITHCVTRLRFKLRDKNIADIDKLKALDGVIDVASNDVSFQVIIGTHVAEVYEELMAMADLNPGSSLNGVKESEKGFKGMIMSVFSSIAETINPFLDILMTAGMVAAVLSILVMAGVLSTESPTYIVFDAIKTGIFTFLPVLVAAGYAKSKNVSQYLAMALAFALVVPSINGVEGLSVFGIRLQTITYTNGFIPALLGTWFLCLIYKFLDKRCPKNVSFFLVPGFSLAVTLPIVLIFFGPIGNMISEVIGWIIQFLMDEVGIWVAITFMSLVKPFLTVTGSGAFTVPIILNSLSIYGYDPVCLPGGQIADFAICGALFGGMIRAIADGRKKKIDDAQKQVQLFGSTAVSALMGITEPGLFGVFLKFRRPFIATAIGGGIGGLIAGIAEVKTYGFVWGLTSLPTYLSGGTQNFIGMLTATVVSFVISAVVAYVMGIPRETDKEEKSVETVGRKGIKTAVVGKVTDGTIIPLREVSDQVFASGALGKGLAIIPQNKTADIMAPVSGVLETLHSSKHAYGIRTEEGMEVLIHIGVDTVNLEGKGFESFVEQGQMVQRGENLCRVDFSKVSEGGFDPTVMVVITNTNDYLDVIPCDKDSDDLLSVVME